MGNGLSVAQLEVWDGSRWNSVTSPVDVSSNQFFRVIFASISQDGDNLMPISSDSQEITLNSTNGGTVISSKTRWL